MKSKILFLSIIVSALLLTTAFLLFKFSYHTKKSEKPSSNHEMWEILLTNEKCKSLSGNLSIRALFSQGLSTTLSAAPTSTAVRQQAKAVAETVDVTNSNVFVNASWSKEADQGVLKINMTSPESLLPGKCETKEISLTAKSFLNNTISGDWEYGTFTMNWISGGKPGLPVVGFKNEHVLVSSENVTVSWSPFPGAESYTVYTFLAESIDYKNPTNILEAKKNYAIVTNLKNGTNYRFIVVAIVDNQEFHSSNLIARPGIPIKSKMFAIGDHHGCAVLFDERVLCWGANSEGQVGDGSKTTWSLPAFVQNLKNEPIASISALRNQTCVNYKDSKQKQCWGSIDGVDHPRPNLNLVQPQSLKLEKLVENSLQNGKNFACIMNQENHILCWGDNQFGQLGNGSGHFSSIPLFVTN